MYKEQGKTEERVKLHIKDFASTHGVVLVAISRVKEPGHNFIPLSEWPTCLDIREQRLKPTTLEADTFERVVKIKGAQTGEEIVRYPGI